MLTDDRVTASSLGRFSLIISVADNSTMNMNVIKLGVLRFTFAIRHTGEWPGNLKGRVAHVPSRRVLNEFMQAKSYYDSIYAFKCIALHS